MHDGGEMLRGGEHISPTDEGVSDAEAKVGECDLSGDELRHEDGELGESERRESGEQMPARDVPW